MRSSDIIMKIMEMDIVQAYNWISTIDDVPDKVRKEARWGWLSPPIDLHDYMHGNITTKNKKARIIYHGRSYRSKDFWTDIERRQKIMKKWMVMYYDQGGIAGARKTKVVTVKEALEQ